MSTHWLFAALVALIILSGLFSSSETGMMSLNRYRLRHRAKEGHRAAKRTLGLLQRPDRLLGVILLGNTAANILASAIATMLAVKIWGAEWVWLATVLLTFAILIFSEAAPKTLAALHPEKIAYPLSWPLKILLRIFYPLVWLVNTVANSILWLFRIRVGVKHEEQLSIEELRSVVNESTGRINANYQDILLRILSLENMDIDDVLIPKAQIEGLDITLPWDRLVTHLLALAHRYVPVYRDHIDQVDGMLCVHDALVLLAKKQLDLDSLQALLKPVSFVPEGTMLHDQLNEFLKNNTNIALVVDEYGEILGLVTITDLYEEIAGEFAEDLRDTKQMIRCVRDGSLVIDGSIAVRELNKIQHWRLPESGPKTLSGLLIEYLETIPNGPVCLTLAGHCIEVLSVDGKMIRHVRVLPKQLQKV